MLYSTKCIESPQSGAFDSYLIGMELKAMLHTMLCNDFTQKVKLMIMQALLYIANFTYSSSGFLRETMNVQDFDDINRTAFGTSI